MSIFLRRTVGVGFALLLCLSLQSALADPRYVDPAGADEENDCTVQAAPCATIAHAISLSNPGDDIYLSTGAFTESNVVVDRSVTIRGTGETSTFVQAGTEFDWWMDTYDIDRVFYVTAGVQVFIHDLSIRYGCAREAFGSGIYNEGELTLTSTSVQYNSGYSCGGGGGIYSSGILVLNQSDVSNNFAYLGFDGSAAGIDNAGTMEIRDSRVYSNHTDHFIDNAGIYNRSGANALISDSDISENGSGSISSGGIENVGTMTIERSTIRANYSSWGYSGSISNGGDLSITQSVISDNYGNIGAIWNVGLLDIRNSTVSGNTSEDEFGGLYNSGTLLSTNNTIVNNRSYAFMDEDEPYASSGAGGLTNVGDVTLKNTIIAGNSSFAGQQDCSTHSDTADPLDAPIDSHGFNLIEDATGCEINEVENPGTDLTGIDPMLEPLSDNGGHGHTHAFAEDSPVFDAIPYEVNSCGTEINEDQRGFPRPSGSGCDIGAFELEVDAETLLADLIGLIHGLDILDAVKQDLIDALQDAERSYLQGSYLDSWTRISDFIDLTSALSDTTMDQLIADATYIISVIKTENGGDSTVHNSLLDDAPTASEFRLDSNYPNPFNATTRINFHLPSATQVTMVIYDVVGREVARPVNGPYSAGDHEIAWNAAGLPSGVYIYRLESGAQSMTRQMTLLK